ncbi:MAG TPA: hypothetical protein VEY89_13310, partial [Candidatus Dormibacteraeota bacterium]|nr:hypothetical protein [Candidatus Dormibacteraeota bacterium]
MAGVLGASHLLVALLVPGAVVAEDAVEGMAGLDGPYAVTREGSGTSWQPDSTPMAGPHAMHGPWMTMLHGMADLVYDDQGGPRGATQPFSSSMLMFMARHELD